MKQTQDGARQVGFIQNHGIFGWRRLPLGQRAFRKSASPSDLTSHMARRGQSSIPSNPAVADQGLVEGIKYRPVPQSPGPQAKSYLLYSYDTVHSVTRRSCHLYSSQADLTFLCLLSHTIGYTVHTISLWFGITSPLAIWCSRPTWGAAGDR